MAILIVYLAICWMRLSTIAVNAKAHVNCGSWKTQVRALITKTNLDAKPSIAKLFKVLVSLLGEVASACDYFHRYDFTST